MRLVLGRRATRTGLVPASLVGAALVCVGAGCAGDGKPPAAGAIATEDDPSLTADAGVRTDADASAEADGGTARPDGAVAESDAGPKPDAERPADPTSVRLVVTDATDDKLYVLDAADPTKPVAELQTSRGSRIVRGSSGRYGYVFAATDSAVRVLDVGLDSANSKLLAPAYLDVALVGKPRGVFASSAGVAIGFDGLADFANEAALVTGVKPVQFTTGEPHDGVPFFVGDARVYPFRDDASAPAVLKSASEGVLVSVPECANPTLAVGAAGVTAVACNGGVALLTKSGNAISAARYASFGAAGENAVLAAAAPGKPLFGFVGADRQQLLTLDAAGSHAASATEPVVALAFDATGKSLWVLGRSGALSAYGPTLEPLSITITTACATVDGDPLPVLLAAANKLFLTCPAMGALHVVSEDASEPVVVPVGSAPRDLAAFAFSR